ncbi:hypothetical protein HG537_0A02440 [Torulaspora globosa]|uniref:Nuclear pore complex protein n=1 Tax=Torulaspora globosa TaxID=48254 RepID=A0A7H9HML5_9SACH|nr:hypothetical protein HG537_0A02440 [Torulaspora sp. CBS 2947]
MEVDGKVVQGFDCALDFANALKDFIAGGFDEGNGLDPFDIVREFRSIAAKCAIEVADKQSEIFKDWELEIKLWHLFEILMSFRTADQELESMEVRHFNSSAVFEKQLLHENRQLYQIWLIMVWIQTNMTPPSRPSGLPTTKWSNTLISGGLKSCDLDYPLRNDQVQLDPKDKEEDSIFFKYIYELLIAGKIEEALEECKLSDNLTISMILCGMQVYVDPRIDTQVSDDFESRQGIKKHALWRRTVYSLAKDPKLNQYERAIYCFLAGDIPPEGITDKAGWDSGLLLYLNQILQIEVENYLKNQNKISKDELILPMPSHALDLQNVLNLLSSRYPAESEHPIRVLMGGIILDTLQSVLHSAVKLLLEMIQGQTTENDMADKPYLLRIVTHMSIVLDLVNPGIISPRDKSKLITAYLSIMKLHNLYEVIPVYISFLQTEDVIEAYSFILSTLEDQQVRAEQLEISNFLRLPTSNILRKTAERVFAETEPDYTPKDEITVTYEIASVDKHLIFSVEWLLQGRLYIDAVDSVIALSRRFLINGKIKSLEYFMSRNSLDDLLKNYKLDMLSRRRGNDDNDDVKVKEIQEYQRLIAELKKFEEWRKTVSQLNSESNVPSLIERFQEYSKGTFELIRSFFVELYEQEDHPDRNIYFEIRSLYTPYLIIELHKELVEAALLLKIPTFIREALKFVNLVANETDKIYLLFQSSGKLQEYLKLVAQTATLSGDTSL